MTDLLIDAVEDAAVATVKNNYIVDGRLVVTIGTVSGAKGSGSLAGP